MSHRVDQKGRRPDSFHESRVKEVLPSYIRENYPKLLNFLTDYYQFMDSDGSMSFDNKIHELLSIRDVEEAPQEFLDLITYEIGARLENTDKFDDERFSLQRLAYLYREKGTPKGIEEFFKLFFQTDVEVVYPKKDIFLIGEDEIGPDYEHYIQDYRLYQNYSVLLRTGLSRSQYETLYKKFMHPAGWYFEGEVTFTGQADLNVGTSLAIQDSAIASYISQAYTPIFYQSRFTEKTFNSTANEVYYSEQGGSIKTGDWKTNDDYQDSNVDMLFYRLEEYGTTLVGDISKFYAVGDFDANSHTFDEDSASTPRMGFSNTFETMDNDMFTRYDPWFHHRDSSL